MGKPGRRPTWRNMQVSKRPTRAAGWISLFGAFDMDGVCSRCLTPHQGAVKVSYAAASAGEVGAEYNEVTEPTENAVPTETDNLNAWNRPSYPATVDVMSMPSGEIAQWRKGSVRSRARRVAIARGISGVSVPVASQLAVNLA